MKVPNTIWDLAIQQSKEKRANVLSKADQQLPSERSLLILGNRGVGKTTLIHRFLESQDSAKPTLALEYTFGRKTNNNLAKVMSFTFLKNCFAHWIFSWFFVSRRKHVASKLSAVKVIFCRELS